MTKRECVKTLRIMNKRSSINFIELASESKTHRLIAKATLRELASEGYAFEVVKQADNPNEYRITDKGLDFLQLAKEATKGHWFHVVTHVLELLIALAALLVSVFRK